MTKRLFVALTGSWLVVGLYAGCATRGSQARLMGFPHIDRVVPDTGLAGVANPLRAAICGRGFAPDGNTVQIGPVRLEGVAADSLGRVITLWIPKEMPSTGEAPPLPLGAGNYPVTVSTGAGVSNVVTLTLVDSRDEGGRGAACP